MFQLSFDFYLFFSFLFFQSAAEKSNPTNKKSSTTGLYRRSLDDGEWNL